MSGRPINDERLSDEQAKDRCLDDPREDEIQRKVVSFDDLARGQRVVVIDFNGQHYRLRRTKSGRLVLTK